MARVEKTVFISYRRKDISWALAVYQYLTSQKYDVFFDYTSIQSGDFEQIIVSNIKARAHFVLILTPTALDRCNEPGDWLRREIETAIDERRNIIPLFFDGFSFGSPSIADKLTGKLAAIQRYNGLDIPSGYFIEAMERLRDRYLNVPLNAVLHPVSTEVQKAVKEEQIAVNRALAQRWEDIKELFRPAEEKSVEEGQTPIGIATEASSPSRHGIQKANLRLYGISAGILLVVALALAGINAWMNSRNEITPTMTSPGFANTISVEPSLTALIDTATVESQTSTPTENSIPTVTATPTPGIRSTLTSPKDEMVMVYVPAGEFKMGNTAENALADCQKRRMTSNCQLDWFKDEEPPHTVYLDSFWIDQTEITNTMFAEFLNLNPEGNKSEGGVTWLKGGSDKVQIHLDGSTWKVDSGFENYPVIEVSWYGAKAYCSWAGRRLPTEAEWEKAASWDEEKQIKTVYPWGDDIDCPFANFNDGSKPCKGKTTAVRSYPRGVNPYGLFDMAGNVWEWVNDRYGKDYYATLVDSSRNPPGPSDGEKRVLRGGSWYSYDFDVRSSRRYAVNPILSSDYIGFRCAGDE
ncbi:MAG TPA: SUMF1/EgtB/PvdO family nonheme iron enzyme [Anaerolineales bacterium]|nr:SUMF1/EgtB/PvdO family nonheme iron enzyme [Anaerolineales bacterium]